MKGKTIMKKEYMEPKLEITKFNVEDRIMSIQPYDIGADGGGWGPDPDSADPTAYILEE